MKNSFKLYTLAIIAMAVVTTLTTTAFGQTKSGTRLTTTQQVVAPVYPHDFSDTYYKANGVDFTTIQNRLTGADFLSVATKSYHPNYAHVRALITMPAYTATGERVFWNPFGTITTGDDRLLALAQNHPIYIFPATSGADNVKASTPFSFLRQASIIDDISSGYVNDTNPLGLRQIVRVTFLQPATKKAVVVRQEMINRNGANAEGNPVVTSIGDLNTLALYNLVSIVRSTEIAIAPIITSKSAFAKDAFLSYATQDGGKPLDAEVDFLTTFQAFQGAN